MKNYLPTLLFTKKIIFVFLFIVLLQFSIFNFQFSIFADFDQAYQDYLYQYDQYRKNLTNFLTAKNRYLTYQTLTSQTEALTATKNLLEARDLVIITYIQMLLGKNPQESFKKILNEEIKFYSDHKNLIPAVGSLDDAVEVSNKFEEHFPLTEVVARQTIADIVLAKVMALDGRLTSLISGFEEKINMLKNQGKDVSTIERWLLETKNKQLMVRTKIDEAQTLASKLKPRKYPQESSREFNKVQVLIFEANQYLKEATTYLQEIKEELKYGNY